MGALLRAPLVHFLVIGTLLFSAERTLFPSIDTIALSAAEQETLRESWRLQTGRAPTAAQFNAAVQARVDEEILLREAIAQGWDERDRVVRERLLRNLRFAFPEDRSDDASLLRAARRMGMNERDRVVRQRLIERMKQQLARGANPTESQVQDYMARHAARYAQPARYSFEQRYFSNDLRHAQALPAAQGALTKLRRGNDVSGDAFLLGEKFEGATPAQLTQRFGAAFSAALEQAPTGSWSGPYASAYGQHLVRVTRREDEKPMHAGLNAQAAYAALTERERAAVTQALTALRQHYRVELERTS